MFATLARHAPIGIAAGLVPGIGGLMFGYSIGVIGGCLAMSDFTSHFGTGASSQVTGAIVGGFPFGCLGGAFAAGTLAQHFGRTGVMSGLGAFACLGLALQLVPGRGWPQFLCGKLLEGFAIGGLSVVAPMYQTEISPTALRTLFVSSFQLMVVVGLLVGQGVTYATSRIQGPLSWRLAIGLELPMALLLAAAIPFFPQSPEFDFGRGREEKARENLAKLNGTHAEDDIVAEQMDEYRRKQEEAREMGDAKWRHVFTAPRMRRRILIGIALQAGQQLTGINYFFYFGPSVMTSMGIDNGFLGAIILGSANLLFTFFGLWVAKSAPRRVALISGALVMAICFIVYAVLGHCDFRGSDPVKAQRAGRAMLGVSAVFISAFASTWGPLAWAVTNELYPVRHRSVAMGITTSANWLMNGIIAIATGPITQKIDYLYGLVFAVSCLGLVVIVYMFVIESKDRPLEEIDDLYLNGANPRNTPPSTASTSRRETLRRADYGSVPSTPEKTEGAGARRGGMAEVA